MNSISPTMHDGVPSELCDCGQFRVLQKTRFLKRNDHGVWVGVVSLNIYRKRTLAGRVCDHAAET